MHKKDIVVGALLGIALLAAHALFVATEIGRDSRLAPADSGAEQQTASRTAMNSLILDAADVAPREHHDVVASLNALSPYSLSQLQPKTCVTQGIDDPLLCEQQVINAVGASPSLPEECARNGIGDAAGCEAHLRILLPKPSESLPQPNADTYTPELCRERGVMDMTQCRALLLATVGRPSICAGASDERCWRLIMSGSFGGSAKLDALAVNSSCGDAGAKTTDECDVLTRKSTMPAECTNAGITDLDACDRLMFAEGGSNQDAFFPDACAANGITDTAACGRFLALTTLPSACVGARISTNSDCTAYIERTLVVPLCAERGITDPASCRGLLSARINADVDCVGVGAVDCRAAIGGRLLDSVVAADMNMDEDARTIASASDADGIIRPKVALAFNKAAYAQLAAIFPTQMSFDAYMAARSSTRVAVTADDRVMNVYGELIMANTAGDGVPDDIKRLQGAGIGRTITNKKAFIRAYALTPVEEAIVRGKRIEQPINRGAFDTRYSVEYPKRDGGARVLLQGSAPPNATVSIFIYGDIPLLLLTRADANGQWGYAIVDALADGPHTAYAAENDSDGAIIGKSDPLTFFIADGQAESVATALDAATPSQPRPQ